MKRFLLIIICLLGLAMTGCMKDYPLTEVQTDMVAEYMASRLLENDKNFTTSLLSYNEVSEIEKNRLEDYNQPEPTEIPKVSDKDNTVDMDGSSSSDTTTDTQYTLSEVIGEAGFNIQYTGYMLADTYPEDESSLVFSLDSREGYQLLVANFEIENTTDTDKIIDLRKAGIKYQLDINVGTIYMPQLALVENNMQYINLEVKAGSKIPAILIFEVNKDVEMSDINLIVSRDARTEIIDIK